MLENNQLYHADWAAITARNPGMDQDIRDLFMGSKPIRLVGRVVTQRRVSTAAHTPLARRRETDKFGCSSSQLVDAIS